MFASIIILLKANKNTFNFEYGRWQLVRLMADGLQKFSLLASLIDINEEDLQIGIWKTTSKYFHFFPQYFFQKLLLLQDSYIRYKC